MSSEAFARHRIAAFLGALLLSSVSCGGKGGSSGSGDGSSGSGGSSTSGPTNQEACHEIVEACHYKDDGTDPMISGCHDTAHGGGDADCLSILDACVEYCNAAPPLGTGSGSGTASGTGSSGTTGTSTTQGGSTGSGTSSGGSTGSGGTSGGGTTSTSGSGSGTGSGGGSSSGASNPGCAAYCVCMQGSCGDQPTYPWADSDACEAACDAFTDDELACYDMWCLEVDQGGDPVHLCEHAWGDFGLNEC